MEPQPRWLSLQGICKVLDTTEDHVRWLVDNGYLEKLPGPKPRYLDPTPHYADRLRLAEAIYRRRNPIPDAIDLDSKAIFTVAEIAGLLGTTLNYTRLLLFRQKYPCVKMKGKTGLRLYTAQTVREIVWRREGRKLSPHKCPVLIPELIRFFHQHQEDIPTDQALAQDDNLKRKLERIMKMPEPRRAAALKDLLDKTGLVKALLAHAGHQ